MHDLVIRNGLIVDGSGEKPFTGDIAILDEKISLGATIKYIAFTQNEKTPFMLFPQRNKIYDYLEIDNASKRNLEIVKSLNGDSEGSLFNSLNFIKESTIFNK